MVYIGGGVLGIAAMAAAAFLLLSGGDEADTANAALPDGGSVPEQKTVELAGAAKAAGCELKAVRIPAREHVAGKVRYSSKPAAGGNHFEIPAEDGAYEAAPPTERLVHALEHGRVVVWFKRSLPEKDRANLRAYFENDAYQQLLTPDATGSRYAVAATAWNRDPVPLGGGRLLGCPRMSDAAFDALATFRDEHRGDGPEAVP